MNESHPEFQPAWQVAELLPLPDWFVQAVQSYTPESSGHAVAQLLWRRGIRDLSQLAAFLDPAVYQPTGPWAFGQEMQGAVDRIQQARDRQERVAIWGDFDADGITATAVLWEGLGQFLSQNDQLVYYIPNRLTESHGLSPIGIEQLAARGCRLIVTCDTGSTNAAEIDLARHLGIDIIVTDHHTLLPERPPVVALINPRSLPPNHPLAHLSGVAVAYKLVEALYAALPAVPQQPLAALLDLVAIGLIADLVELTGDCRYLAQRGIERLQQNRVQRHRPGVASLLQLCKRSGDRPTDIAFGLGPRINAVSRVQGDASFCVELLTSRDPQRCQELAELTELANIRRQALQQQVLRQAQAKLSQIDRSTQVVIVLEDSQWPVGILGLVAGQLAQEYDRPVILLSADLPDPEDAASPTVPPEERNAAAPRLARGSARSARQIDLYQLMQGLEHLLSRFGGHPFAAGLCLPVDNISLFTEAINQKLRQQTQGALLAAPVLRADLVVTVSALGKSLFRELKLLEPCGMGNPIPRLLLQNCWFDNIRHANLRDPKGRKVRYIKTTFAVWDETTSQGFPGVWWGHYKEELPTGRCDVIAELDFNAANKNYELRLVAVRPHQLAAEQPHPDSAEDWILDWRDRERNQPDPAVEDAVLRVTECPRSWDDLQRWLHRALQSQKKLAIAYTTPTLAASKDIWPRLLGVAKYLGRTQQIATFEHLQEKLGLSDNTLQFGLKALQAIGFEINVLDFQAGRLQMRSRNDGFITTPTSTSLNATQQFLTAVQEEHFRQSYFCTVPLSTIQAMVNGR